MTRCKSSISIKALFTAYSDVTGYQCWWTLDLLRVSDLVLALESGLTADCVKPASDAAHSCPVVDPLRSVPRIIRGSRVVLDAKLGGRQPAEALMGNLSVVVG